jgi:hypothetical protein
MALVVADRVKETTTTTGTGAITLAGAETNFVTFSSVLSNADTTYYAIVDNTNSAFEVGLGTYASSGNTITRTTIISSSNSNNAVDLQAGSKDVFVTLPSNKFPLLDASGNVDINGGTIDGTTIGGSSAAAGTFTTANATTVDTTNIEATNIKAKDGTSAGSIADSTGVVTIASSVLTTTDINGGTADGVTIGGSTAAAGTFTTFTSTGIDDNADATAITIDSSEAVAIGGSTFIGSRAKSLSIVGDDNSSTIASKTTSYDTVFSVLPWSSSTTYLATGTYFDDGSWIHASDNATSSLVALTGDGVHWYASSGSTPNFDVANNVGLWNASGQWDGDINTTYDINTGSITVGDGTNNASHIAIKPADDTTAEDLQFYNGTTRVGEIGTQDTVWLRINQETSSNIYTPRYIRADGGFFVDGTTKGIDGSGDFIGGNVTTPTLNVNDGNTQMTEGDNNAFRLATNSGYVDVGPMNSSYCHIQTDRGKFYLNKPTYMDGGAVDYDTGDHFILPNANNSESPNSSTSRNGGAINYIYNRSVNVTLTRGDFAHHIVQQWSYGPTFTLTSSTWLRGDIIEFINVKGAVTITVVGTIIYLPNGGNDTTLTLSQAGKFRLIRYSSNAGYWMVG